ncbi:hypothetical protein FHL15_011041 [Xylaria flabelliformis]|uniref:Uncharacterized protein n=1 Tax=Xylaria flabelliformis TaxID=2512241 RepID=A0A553HJG2_9PEZI|nr:hypothetical protein FHL15_011041 [Xylaria flabelliformis]
MDWDHCIIRYTSDKTEQQEYATAVPYIRDDQKRTSSNNSKPGVGHKRWISSTAKNNQNQSEGKAVIEDVFTGYSENDTDQVDSGQTRDTRSFIENSKDFDLEDFSQLKDAHSTREAISIESVEGFGPEGSAQAEWPQSVSHMGYENLFASLIERYNNMGEEALLIEEGQLHSITRPGQGTRVIWGFTNMNPRDSLDDCWDHWFGPMRHYEYWLGDTESTAIYIRMDQAKPDGQAKIPFSALESLFEDGGFNTDGLFNALDEAFKSLDDSYIASLQAFASLYSLYRTLAQSSIDVRILIKPLAQTQWFRSLFESSSVTSRPLDPPPEKRDYNSEYDFLSVDDEDMGSNHAETCFMDALHAMEVSPSQQESPRKPRVSGEALIPRVLNFLRSRAMSTEQSFSCVLLCEGSFDIASSRLKDVIALSSSNSLFVDASLTCDPAISPRRTKIRHVMGNIGKPGAALLVPPIEPSMMTLGIERWHLINFSAWDGQARDCFADSSLHIWFTGFTQEVDVGGYSGSQDKELYVVESVVSLYAKAEWIADLDILKTIQSPSLIYRHVPILPVKERHLVPSRNHPPGEAPSVPLLVCEDSHQNEYQYQKIPLVAVENWTELVTDTPKNCIFLANKNWQARLAAMMICIAKGRRVCLLSDDVCWDCINLGKKFPFSGKDPIVYIH